MGGGADVGAERLHPRVVHILGRARQADGGDDRARCVAHRGGDAAYLVLIFLQIEGAAIADIGAHPLEPEGRIGIMGAIGAFSVEQASPDRFAVVQQQRLAKASGGQGVAITDAAGNVDAAAAGDLVEIERLIAVEPAQMDRILAGGGERLQMRAGDLHHVRLGLCQKAQLQQLWPQLIAFARQEGQEAALHHGIGEAMGGRSGEAHAFRQVGKLDRPVDHLIEQVQPAMQGLRAGGFRFFLNLNDFRFARFWI